MIYHFRERSYHTVSEVATLLNRKPREVSRAIKYIEENNIFYFKLKEYRTHIIETQEIEFIGDFMKYRDLNLKPKEIKPLMKEKVDKYKEEEQKEKDMEWTRGLKYATWKKNWSEDD